VSLNAHAVLLSMPLQAVHNVGYYVFTMFVPFSMWMSCADGGSIIMTECGLKLSCYIYFLTYMV